MLLDLSEIFVCPRCRPAQGLVVLVDEIRDRRVVRGHLGCPECEARFPVEEGVLRFDAAGGGPPAGRDRGSGASPDASGSGAGRTTGDGEAPAGDAVAAMADGPAPPALFRGASRREAALRLGALLGLPDAGGPFLLGPGLGALAASLAGMTEDEEVLALEAADGPARPGPDGPGPGGGPGTAGDGGEGDAAGRRVTRVVGVAGADLPVFAGRLGGVALLGGAAATVDEAVRTLRAGARVVVVEPSGGVADAAEELPVEVTARDARALVGVRRG